MRYVDSFTIHRASPPYKMCPHCYLVIQSHLDYSHNHDTLHSVPPKHSTFTKQSRCLYASVYIAASYCADRYTYQAFC